MRLLPGCIPREDSPLPSKEDLQDMRSLSFVILMLSLSGCGKTPPTMGGGKWAEALRDPDAKVRKKAAFTLGNIGPSDPAVLPALTAALKDADAGVRCEAVLALLKYGPGARGAVPELTEVHQKDRDAKVREYAAKAVEKLRSGN
jgi:HEAT repeats